MLLSRSSWLARKSVIALLLLVSRRTMARNVLQQDFDCAAAFYKQVINRGTA